MSGRSTGCRRGPSSSPEISGNDIEMLRLGAQAIIVGNYSDDLADHAALKHSYVARASHARASSRGWRISAGCAPMRDEASASVLTLVRGRADHLRNLMAGLARQTVRPRELVIAWMQPDRASDLPDPGCPVRHLHVPGEPMPLAAARNRAAEAASGTLLIFLDVDCIRPRPSSPPTRARRRRPTGCSSARSSTCHRRPVPISMRRPSAIWPEPIRRGQ